MDNRGCSCALVKLQRIRDVRQIGCCDADAVTFLAFYSQKHAGVSALDLSIDTSRLFFTKITGPLVGVMCKFVNLIRSASAQTNPVRAEIWTLSSSIPWMGISGASIPTIPNTMNGTFRLRRIAPFLL
jgi:hypothetical protein